jgi:hypothetical protein
MWWIGRSSVLHIAIRDVGPTCPEACRAPQYHQSSSRPRSKGHAVPYLCGRTKYTGRTRELCRWRRGPESGSANRRPRHPVLLIEFPHYQPPPPISTKGGLTNQLFHDISDTQYPHSSSPPTRRSSVSPLRTNPRVWPMWGRVLIDGEVVWVLAPDVH